MMGSATSQASALDLASTSFMADRERTLRLQQSIDELVGLQKVRRLAALTRIAMHTHKSRKPTDI